jgi:N-acetylglutamate synthase-like GNAT family acetyltransferase
MIIYRSVEPEDLEPLQEFISTNGWAHRVSNQESFQTMLAHADRTVVALDGERIIGFARALCDGVSNGYISMVVVAEDMRHQGIGRSLVQQIMRDDTSEQITWVLRAGRGSEGFWGRLGFRTSEIGMERVRK